MKKLFILILPLLTVGVFTLPSCGGDEPDPNGGEIINPTKPVADPDGTITLSMHDYDNGETYILDRIYIKNENFKGVDIASVGSVNGLGNVSTIPTTGWTDEVAVVPGNGYVAYLDNRDMFVRIYVTDYITSTSGGIMGADVKYQYPFKGSDESLQLEKSSVTLTAEGGSDNIAIKNSNFIPFNISADESWINVQKTSTYMTHILYNGIMIGAADNTSTESREGTVTLTTLYGKQAKIKVTQAPRTETFLPAPPSSNLSVRVDADDNGQPDGFIDQNTNVNTGIVTVETTEEGKVGIGLLPSSPLLDRNVTLLRGVEKKDINALLTILFFDATLTGNTYQLGSYGTIIIIRDGVKFKFILNLFGCEYTFTATPKEKLPASDRTTSLCRDWKVKSCQVQTKVSGATIGKNFNGCNLNEIESWLIGKGVNISPKDRLPAKSNIQLLSFTRSGSYMIKYENEKIDAADWLWVNESQGVLKYIWRGEDMGNAYEAGACTAKFYAGNCQLSIEATIHSSDGNDYPSKLVAILAD